MGFHVVHCVGNVRNWKVLPGESIAAQHKLFIGVVGHSQRGFFLADREIKRTQIFTNLFSHLN